MDSSQELIAFLIKQDPASVHQWLNEVCEGVYAIPNNFNWKHLAAAIEVLQSEIKEKPVSSLIENGQRLPHLYLTI